MASYLCLCRAFRLRHFAHGSLEAFIYESTQRSYIYLAKTS
jgi:hypothetical protein